jgi:signal transduction histidine kinase
LVENALAHSTTASPICVGADLEERDVILWVENDGELPFEDPDELFQPFQRGPDATSSGVGLGLYIARRIAVGMSGDLTAHMEEGRVRFCLRFPLRKRGLPAMRPAPSLI